MNAWGAIACGVAFGTLGVLLFVFGIQIFNQPGGFILLTLAAYGCFIIGGMFALVGVIAFGVRLGMRDVQKAHV